MPHSETLGWDYLGDSSGGGPFMIDGVDIWKHKWITPPDQHRITLVYGGEYVRLYEYFVALAGKHLRFAAGEVVYNGYAFCIPTPA
jgi:hypothetical protein